MSTGTVGTGTTSTGAMTTTVGRLAALGRAECTLLLRNRTALFVAVLVPIITIGGFKSSLNGIDPDKGGPTVIELAMIGSIGMVLIMAVYANLAAAYTSRREDLVLKRLRTVEASDTEILTGTALPAVALALLQSVVLVAAGVAFLGGRAPQRADLLVAGLLGGILVLVALAAVTSAFTRTVESAQITIMPLFLVSIVGSGLFVPLTVMPDNLAAFCEMLPMTGAMTLIRAGWLGGVGAHDLGGAALTTVAWIVVSLFAVRKWFRWEPRR
ncbi:MULTISPECIES: ABC transporter permease [unclassified Streptomyces]|uniref:ABC transporter permease n=1 Tax=unclassified Streptomyces TaxID=2593676 RepID=UPI0037FD31E4